MNFSVFKTLCSLGMIGVLLFSMSHWIAAAPRDNQVKRITVSGKVMATKLKHSVEPVYPVEALKIGIGGTVKMTAVIATDGSVQQLRVEQGHPLLVKSALDAVKQWKYEPTEVDGTAVEVLTSIFVVFQLKN